MENRNKLVFKKGEKYYHFATIKLDLEKKELIYIPEYSFSKKEFARYTDYEKAIVQTRRSIDHISFHKDGTAHVVSKNMKGKKERMDPKKGPSNPFDIRAENYAPLLLHSGVHNENFPIAHLIKVIDGETLVFEMNNQDTFSVVLFSVGVGVNWKLLLRKFSNVFDGQKSKFLVEPFLVHKENDILRIQQGSFLDIGLLFAFTSKSVPMPKILISIRV
ncbi:MAG: hypothetical protein A3G09_03220 [Candidatus Moranbacteria bacterium RIFCSPLOWO2_12_FULL_48_12]|nr:MAG: hypothetical protein A3G09_03220 [Candidatus Moranbacteria bacterium RIFCSPLOWO2_12_FULL_48_12]